MKRIVRLTESDLTRIVRRVINEQEQTFDLNFTEYQNKYPWLQSIGTDKAAKEVFFKFKPEYQKHKKADGTIEDRSCDFVFKCKENKLILCDGTEVTLYSTTNQVGELMTNACIRAKLYV